MVQQILLLIKQSLQLFHRSFSFADFLVVDFVTEEAGEVFIFIEHGPFVKICGLKSEQVDTGWPNYLKLVADGDINFEIEGAYLKSEGLLEIQILPFGH